MIAVTTQPFRVLFLMLLCSTGLCFGNQSSDNGLEQLEGAIEKSSQTGLVINDTERSILDSITSSRTLVMKDDKQKSDVADKLLEYNHTTPLLLLSPLNGTVKEDAPIGTLILTIRAVDGNKEQLGKVVFELINNPLHWFLLDPETGELRTTKPLDKEALDDPEGILTVTVRAHEVLKETNINDPLMMTTVKITITIEDVNDEAPRFNYKDYTVTIPENLPEGTLLPHLDMTVKDPDVGKNSIFTLRLEDTSGTFEVEPKSAIGSTLVNIRISNGSFDYENPNWRKIVILVIAEEQLSKPQLSSTATVTVVITDVNDNEPMFENNFYTAMVTEISSPGTVVTIITATDIDSGLFGEDSIIYELSGNGSDKFLVNNKTGVITVAECVMPGKDPCLNYESQPEYLLILKATDNNGYGHTSAVPVKIHLIDSNDNTPTFSSSYYLTTIVEGAKKFEPQFFIQAEDSDVTSKITYSIIEGNINNLFNIDNQTGEITVHDSNGLDITNITTNIIKLIIQASDGMFATTATVQITVHDINNNKPVFERESYVSSIEDDALIGTRIERTKATDADCGANARIRYGIHRNAFNDFDIEEDTGVVKIARLLDYEKRNMYHIEVIAVDGGTPALTGTTTLTVSVINRNNSVPFFVPSTQRAEVSEDAAPGTVFYTLQVMYPDMNSSGTLNFIATEPITAVDLNGKSVKHTDAFKFFFAVDKMTGEVSIANPLLHNVAAVVRLTVLVTDIATSTKQHGRGLLIITITDVNNFSPTFPKPWSSEEPKYTINILEEQPVGSVVGSFVATDVDSKISGYTIDPENEYFEINNVSGIVLIKKRIDYEEVKQLNFTLFAYDSGVPQLSSSADIVVNVININDKDPIFSKPAYEATLLENSPIGAHVITVMAKDGDDEAFGKVTYSLVGEHSGDFRVGQNTGEVTVANPALLDHERLPELILEVVASDSGPSDVRKTTAATIHIKLLDLNDNAPVFNQKHYQTLIMDNLPPSHPIIRLLAEDIDDGINGAVHYSIIAGNEADIFQLNSSSGILYSTNSLVGKAGKHQIIIEARDQNGLGEHSDNATVEIRILSVNQNKPEFIMPALENATVEIPKDVRPDFLVMTVKAMDKDSGENGRISYHLIVGNNLTQQTNEFTINAETGELRTKISLDMNVETKYDLTLIAKDYGLPLSYETMHFLTVLLVDINENKPEFILDGSLYPYKFHVVENSPLRQFIGNVKAFDRAKGIHAQVYYFIISGNEEGGFDIDKTNGSLFTNSSFDREKEEMYNLDIKATNDPNYCVEKEEIEKLKVERDTSIAQVQVTVLDMNDNAPKFLHSDYYAGVNAMANLNELVVKLTAVDPDFGDNGTILYYISETKLFKCGFNKSSEFIIPSQFGINEDGTLVTANYMSEFNQDKFILNIVAKEKAYPNREAAVRVHIWIFEPNQLIRIIFSRPPATVKEEKDEIIAELSNITECLIVVYDIRYHVDSSGRINHDWCDMYLHTVNKTTHTITPISEALKMIDAKFDYLKSYYAGVSIQNVMPAFGTIQEDVFHPAFTALIVLISVLLIGIVTFTIISCHLRHWEITVPNHLKRKEALIKQDILDGLNSEENSLMKMKLYHEKELTMQVFCEPEEVMYDPFQQDSNDRKKLDNLSEEGYSYNSIQDPMQYAVHDISEHERYLQKSWKHTAHLEGGEHYMLDVETHKAL